VVISRSFLGPLSRMPIGRSLTEDEEALFSTLYWSNESELLYLARRDDPGAIRAVIRIAAAGRVPGACCCEAGRFREKLCPMAFSAGASPGFWAVVEGLSPGEQVVAISIMDDVSPVDWDGDVGDREQYLASHAEVRDRYRALHAAATNAGAD